MVDECAKKYGSVSAKDTVKVIKNIETFCSFLNSNKVKDGKEAFLKLPRYVQCLFLKYSWRILREDPDQYPVQFLSAFRMFKLFRSKDFKDKEIYKIYQKTGVEGQYKKALEWNRNQSGTKTKTKTSGTRVSAKTKYEKEYQRRPEPEMSDPAYVFYTSLYKEKSESPLAITWLTEHGAYDGSERRDLIKKYKKLSEKKRLIR